MPPPGLLLLLFLRATLFHLNLFKLLPLRLLQRSLPLHLLFAPFGLLGLPTQSQQRVVLRRCT